jgi:hypothetical protein
MPNAGDLTHILTARKMLRLGSYCISHGTAAPTSATAYGQTDAIYWRHGTGSAATALYVTADSGTTWRKVLVGP